MGTSAAQIRNLSSGLRKAIVQVPKRQHGLQQVRWHPAARLQERNQIPVHQRLRHHEEPRRQAHASHLQRPKDSVAARLVRVYARHQFWRGRVEPGYLLGHQRCHQPGGTLRGHSLRQNKANQPQRHRGRKRHQLQNAWRPQKPADCRHFQPQHRQNEKACEAYKDYYCAISLCNRQKPAARSLSSLQSRKPSKPKHNWHVRRRVVSKVRIAYRTTKPQGLRRDRLEQTTHLFLRLQSHAGVHHCSQRTFPTETNDQRGSSHPRTTDWLLEAPKSSAVPPENTIHRPQHNPWTRTLPGSEGYPKPKPNKRVAIFNNSQHKKPHKSDNVQMHDKKRPKYT